MNMFACYATIPTNPCIIDPVHIQVMGTTRPAENFSCVEMSNTRKRYCMTFECKDVETAHSIFEGFLKAQKLIN